MSGQSFKSGGEEKTVMSCLLCNTTHQKEFVAEINVHFSGLENIEKPGVLLLRRLLVCLECGFSRFTIPKTDLALLVEGTRD